MPEGQVELSDTPEAGQALTGWLEHLSVLMPPQGLAHVGAGSGADLPFYARLNVPQLHLMEADPSQAKRLAEATKGHDGWAVHAILISHADTEQSFHLASNPRESALLPAEDLHLLWRNLKSRGERSMPARSLDSLLKAGGGTDIGINWLVVDCMPAASILSGAAGLLQQCDVVLIRVALGAGEALGQGASLAECAAMLAAHSFGQVALEEERMPLVGRALFVRRPEAVHAVQLNLVQDELAQAYERHAVEIQHREAINLALGAERNALLEFKTEAMGKLTHLQIHIDELHQQKARADQEAAEQTRLMDVLRAQLRGDEERREVQAEDAAARAQQQARIHALEVEKQELEARMGNADAQVQSLAAQLVAERDSLQGQLNGYMAESGERHINVGRLTHELASQAAELQECRRQLAAATEQKHQFDIEMAKAEAQIALIRDVLLRHPEDSKKDAPT